MPGLIRRDRDFRAFWLGQGVSVVGENVSLAALPLIATTQLGAGAGAVGLVAAAATLPNVILPLVVGSWLETRPRRGVMIRADLWRALVLCAIGVAALAGALSLPLLIGAALLVGIATVFFDIAIFAYVPSLVGADDLGDANRALQGAATAAQAAGPGLGGLLVSLAGAAGALLVDGLSYLASAVGVGAARTAEPPPPLAEGPPRILDGLRVVFASPLLRALSLHAAGYNLAWQVLTVNLVVYATAARSMSAGAFGLALSAAGVGAFLGTLASTGLARRVGYGRAFASALVLSTGVPLTLAFLPGDGATLAAEFALAQLVAGIGLGMANVLSTTLRQAVAPAGSLARTNGGYRLLIFGVLPIGSLIGGGLGDLAGSRAGVIVGSFGLLLSAIPMWRRSIRRQAEPPVAAGSVVTERESPSDRRSLGS